MYGTIHTLETTSWNFNCGPASIAHLLQEQLNQSPLPTFFTSDPYQTLLKSFQHIYQDSNLCWVEVKALLETYKHPIDQSIVWSLPLRHFLQASLLNDTHYRNQLFTEFEAIIISLNDGKALNEIHKDYPNLVGSNRQYFEEFIELSETLKITYLSDLKRYWETTAYPKYCKHIGEGIKNFTPMLASTELSKLCEFLRISLTIYAPNVGTSEEIDFTTIQGLTRGYTESKDKVGDLFVSNSGLHWSRLLLDLEKVDAHNFVFHSFPSTFVNTPSFVALLFKIKQNLRGIKLATTQQHSRDFYKFISVNTSNNTLNADNDYDIGRELDLGGLLDHYLNSRPSKLNQIYNIINENSQKYIQRFGYQKKEIATQQAFKKALGCLRFGNYEELKYLIQNHPEIVYKIDQSGNTLLHVAFLNVAKSRHALQEMYHFFDKMLQNLKDCLTNDIILELQLLIQLDKHFSMEALEMCLKQLPESILNQGEFKKFLINVEFLSVLKLNLQKITNFGKGFDFSSALALVMHNIVQQLIAAKAPVNAKNNAGATPLHFAALYTLANDKDKDTDNYNYVSLLLAEKAISIPDSKGLTPLHFAALHNNLEAIERLLSVSCIDHVSQHGLSALHLAALNQRCEAFALLVNKGANPQLKAYPSAIEKLNLSLTPVNSTPFEFAFEKQNEKIIYFMIDLEDGLHKFSSLNDVRNANNAGLIHFVAAKGNVIYFKRLLELNCDPFQIDACHYTPLHLASLFGHKSIVEQILDYKKLNKTRWPLFTSDVDGKTNAGETAWLLAKQQYQKQIEEGEEKDFPSSFKDIMDLLKEAGAKEIEGPSKGKIARAFEFFNKQSQFSNELERTKTYQFLNDNRVYLSVLAHVKSGLIGMTMQGVRLSAVYLPSWVRWGGDKAYYFAKPYFHNNTYRWMDQGFDTVATVSSKSLGAFNTAIRWMDYISSPVRYSFSKTASHTLANVVSYITSNKDIQAASYFSGQILANVIFDSYQHAPKEEGAFDYELNKGYTLWSSLMGKREGEKFVNRFNSLNEWQNQLYEYVGANERAAIKFLSETFPNGQQVMSTCGNYLMLPKIHDGINYYNEQREVIFQTIEGWLNNNLLPEGQARDYANWYLQQNQVGRQKQKAVEAKKALELAEKTAQESEEHYKQCQQEEAALLENPLANALEIQNAQQKTILAKLDVEKNQQALAVAQESYRILNDELIALEEKAGTLWKVTPKGQEEAKLNNAQKEAIDARLALEFAKFKLENLESDNAGEQILTQAKLEVEEAQAILDTCLNTLTESENSYYRESTSLEKSFYLKSKEKAESKLEEHITEWRALRVDIENRKDIHTEAENVSIESALQLLEEENTLSELLASCDDLDRKILALNHPVSFDWVKHIEYAMSTMDDNSEIKDYLLKQIAATGLIDYQEARNRIENQIDDALSEKSYSSRKRALKEKFEYQWGALFTDYKPALINQRNKVLVDIKAQELRCKEALEHFNETKLTANAAKQHLYEILPEEEKTAYETFYIEQNVKQSEQIWNYQNNPEKIKFLLGVMGQSTFAFEASHYTGLMNTLARAKNGSFVFANWLINYKYLFLPTPSAIELRAEIEALSEELKNTPLNASIIEELKLSMDKTIVKTLLEPSQEQANTSNPSTLNQLANNSSSTVLSSSLQRGLSLEELSPELNDAITKAVDQPNDEAVIEAVVSLFNSTVKKISTDSYGEIKPSAAPVQPSIPEFKKRHYHRDRFKKIALEVVLPVLANGVSFGIGGTAVSFAIANGMTLGSISLSNSKKPSRNNDKPNDLKPSGYSPTNVPTMQPETDELQFKPTEMPQEHLTPFPITGPVLSPELPITSDGGILNPSTFSSFMGVTNQPIIFPLAPHSSKPTNPMSHTSEFGLNPSFKPGSPGMNSPSVTAPGAHLSQSNSQQSDLQSDSSDLAQLNDVDASNWKIVMENYPQPHHSALTDLMDKEWEHLVDSSYPSQDEKTYQSALAYSELGKDLLTYSTLPSSSEIPPTQTKATCDLSNKTTDNFSHGVAISAIPEPSSESSKAKEILGRALDYLLIPIVGKKAQANPLVLAPLVAAGVSAAAVGLSAYKAQSNNDNEEPGYPNSLDRLQNFLSSDREEMEEIGGNILPFPTAQAQPSKLETPIEQPGKDDNSLSFPAVPSQGWKLETPAIQTHYKDFLCIMAKHILPLSFLNLNRNNQNTGGEQRIYQHDYEKHKPKAGGFGASWVNASVNPIPNARIGQQLLDSAYSSPTKPRQLFNYHNGKIIKFRSSNDGKWHSYEVCSDIKNQVGNDILKQFKRDELISNSEYKKLLKA